MSPLDPWPKLVNGSFSANFENNSPRSGINEDPTKSLSLRGDSGQRRFHRAGSTERNLSNTECPCARFDRDTCLAERNRRTLTNKRNPYIRSFFQEDRS